MLECAAHTSTNTGLLRFPTVSGALKAGKITGLTTFDVMPRASEPEVAYSGVWAQARWCHDRRPTQREVYSVLNGTGCGPHHVVRRRRHRGGPAWFRC